jgi:scyllo-inositol 2-dehydrogenase (NADP+)
MMGRRNLTVEKEVRVGLVGYGFAGKTFHAPVITSISHLKLAKVVERRTDLSKQRYPWVEVVKSVQELYEDESIDVVVITTPSTNHYDFVKAALLAGKHVVVEKPFTTTTAEADDLISIAKEQGKVLSVFHNRRWDGDFLTIKKLLDGNKLGKLVEAEFRWDRFNPKVNTERWRDKGTLGSGVFYDLGVHFLDQALCLFGMPKTITGDIRIQREGGLTDDYFDVALGYKDGLKVTVKASKVAREQGPRYVFHGTTGSFIKYGDDPQEEALMAGYTPKSPNWGIEPKEFWGTLHTTKDDLTYRGQVQTIPGSYQSYYQNIYDHITGKAELAVKAEEARSAIRLIELGIQSSKEQRTIEV